ncbi:MAG: helix-turn-helix domain-containing protein [Nitrospirae bacterium]|nr:helix-turn-helix domain-containing protein [Nitrospirota bacterium]
MAGELLKRRREELGLDLKQTADLLKIKEDYLASIENDLFEKLPVAVYTIGYIRCYAAYLHIDPEPIIAIYTGHLTQPKPSTIFPVASSKKKIPFYYYVIPAFVIILLILGVFILGQGRAVPEKQMAAVPAPPVQRVEPVPAERQPSRPENETGRSQSQAVPPAVSSQATGIQKPQVSGEHSLVITADDLTWMHIKFSNGKYEEVLLRPGTTRTWQFADKAVLKLGNAGGIRLNLDGKDIGSPGSLGQVMTLVFPENQQINRQGE